MISKVLSDNMNISWSYSHTIQDTKEIFAGVTGSSDVSQLLLQHPYRGGSGIAGNAIAKLRDYVNASPHGQFTLST